MWLRLPRIVWLVFALTMLVDAHPFTLPPRHYSTDGSETPSSTNSVDSYDSKSGNAASWPTSNAPIPDSFVHSTETSEITTQVPLPTNASTPSALSLDIPETRNIGPGPYIVIAFIGLVALGVLAAYIRNEVNRRRVRAARAMTSAALGAGAGDSAKDPEDQAAAMTLVVGRGLGGNGDGDEASVYSHGSSTAHLQPTPVAVPASGEDRPSMSESDTRLARHSVVNSESSTSTIVPTTPTTPKKPRSPVMKPRPVISPPLTPPRGSIMGSWDDYMSRGISMEEYRKQLVSRNVPFSTVPSTPTRVESSTTRPKLNAQASMAGSELTIATFGFTSSSPH